MEVETLFTFVSVLEVVIGIRPILAFYLLPLPQNLVKRMYILTISILQIFLLQCNHADPG